MTTPADMLAELEAAIPDPTERAALIAAAFAFRYDFLVTTDGLVVNLRALRLIYHVQESSNA